MNKKSVFFFLLLCVPLLSSCWTNKSGQKSGIIVKVAKEGNYWGTYEGELIRGGLENASGALGGRAFNFTIGQFHSDLVKKAELALQNNDHVVINYHCEWWVAPWRGETNCFADEIQIVDNLNGPPKSGK